MNHSFAKFEMLLSSNGLVPKTVYTIDGYMVYVEVFNNNNAETFLLYIPSKFNIKPERSCDIYKIKYVDIEESNNIVSKYTEEPDNADIKKDYDDINIETEKSEDIEQQLSENYNREILLKDLKKEDSEILKDIFRQLNRLKFCTQTIKYKLAILYKNYICAIKRDDSIECYYINNFPLKKGRKLYVSIDLKSLYEKIDTVSVDIVTVKDSIYKILNQNQIKHTRVLNSMLENKDKLVSYSEMIYKKKQYFENYLKELTTMLNKLNENENKLREEKNTISNKTGEYGIKGIHTDIQHSHTLFKLEEKLKNVYDLKKELIEDISKTHLEQEHMTLEIDKILFDNSVMLNEMIRNFNSIIYLIE